MKKIIKITLLSVLLILLVLVGGSWIYNKIAIKKEIKETPPPGKMVNVNDHDMHVYADGGTSAPTLDFKPLWSKLSSKHRIAVVEKAGYGWSEEAPVSRDIDTILEETRSALELTGEELPYVLAPHSMSGLEAIRWGQKYPDEVKT